VGVFFLNHMLTNSFAVAGAEAFNHKVEFLRSLPYLYLIEIFGIFLPILFHMGVGVLIYREARFNNRRLGYTNNFLFTLQRITGVVLVFFIFYHLATTRFSDFLFGKDTSDLFILMQDKLQNPWIFLLYVVGTVAAAFHLGNGIFGFTLHWGIVTSREAQKRVARVGIAVAVALALVGVNALLAFKPLGGAIPPVKLFIHEADHGEGHGGDAASLHLPEGGE
jgi:succinate dehydrogenase / fumarate reductase cytochrome b subunit